jgi:hypothetical protein
MFSVDPNSYDVKPVLSSSFVHFLKRKLQSLMITLISKDKKMISPLIEKQLWLSKRLS